MKVDGSTADLLAEGTDRAEPAGGHPATQDFGEEAQDDDAGQCLCRSGWVRGQQTLAIIEPL